MFHLLREDSITRSLDAFPEVGDIPARNIEMMKNLGFDHVNKMFHDLRRPH